MSVKPLYCPFVFTLSRNFQDKFAELVIVFIIYQRCRAQQIRFWKGVQKYMYYLVKRYVFAFWKQIYLISRAGSAINGIQALRYLTIRRNSHKLFHNKPSLLNQTAILGKYSYNTSKSVSKGLLSLLYIWKLLFF